MDPTYPKHSLIESVRRLSFSSLLAPHGSATRRQGAGLGCWRLYVLYIILSFSWFCYHSDNRNLRTLFMIILIYVQKKNKVQPIYISTDQKLAIPKRNTNQSQQAKNRLNKEN